MTTIKTAFIGLGVMGAPMAGYLQTKGYPTTVYNRSAEKAENWVKHYGGAMALTPKAAVQEADMVFMCVGNDNDVRSVVYGAEGIIAGMKEGALLVDHTTSSATLALELAGACDAVGARFIDAPVSGGQVGAEKGALTIMCGGFEADFNEAKPVMMSYAKAVSLLGEHGQGQRCKMVNQICIAGILQGLSEAILLAEKSGLDVAQVVETLKHGAAGSWQMENRAKTMAKGEFNFGFALDWMRKDLAICLNEASRHGLTLPLTQATDERYAKLQEKGMGRMDTSSLIEALRLEQ